MVNIPELSMDAIAENDMCFGCGKANPIGLKLKFSKDRDSVKAKFIPTENHQGWPGYAHGGVLMSVIDEAIGWVTFLANVYNVTAKIEVRLKSMARLGEPLIVTARITSQSKRLLETEVDLKRKDGTLVAEAKSIQFIVNTTEDESLPTISRRMARRIDG